MFPADLDAQAIFAAIETAANQAGLGIYIARIDLEPPTVLYCSARAAEIVGLPVEAIVGQPPWGILIPEDRGWIREALRTPLEEFSARAMEVTAQRPDGTTLPVHLGVTRMRTTTGIISLGYLRDLTTERAAFEALLQSEKRFRFLVDSAPDGVVIVQAGKVVFINERGAQLLANGPTDAVLGKSVTSFLRPDHAALAHERIGRMTATRTVDTLVSEYNVHVDPERIVEIKSVCCDWEGTPALLSFARDVTERKRLQQRLVETDRLAALGTLAAGVAHEINNPLTYATLGLQRIERTLASFALPDDKLGALKSQLREIEHGLGRVASITRGLRSFARPDDTPAGPVAMLEVIESSLRMVDNELRHHARLVRALAPVPSVTGNASRLEQVVVNLLLNAIQAVRNEHIDNEIEVTLARRDDDRVMLSIRDTGRGIPAPVRERIFEPFFTTRAVGDGMGLGLSVCRTIVEGFGGTIDVSSSGATGTTMTITLRVHRGNTRPVLVAPPLAAMSRKRVLIVDDEPLLCDALTRVLSSDHDITTATSGPEALALISSQSFDAVLCDVMMPGMDGVELHRQIAASCPGLERRTAFITGGTFSSAVDDFIAKTGNPLLTKPFQVADVIRAVEAVTRAGDAAELQAAEVQAAELQAAITPSAPRR